MTLLRNATKVAFLRAINNPAVYVQAKRSSGVHGPVATVSVPRRREKATGCRLSRFSCKHTARLDNYSKVN